MFSWSGKHPSSPIWILGKKKTGWSRIPHRCFSKNLQNSCFEQKLWNVDFCCTKRKFVQSRKFNKLKKFKNKLKLKNIVSRGVIKNFLDIYDGVFCVRCLIDLWLHIWCNMFQIMCYLLYYNLWTLLWFSFCR